MVSGLSPSVSNSRTDYENVCVGPPSWNHLPLQLRLEFLGLPLLLFLKRLETILFASDSTDSGRECL